MDREVKGEELKTRESLDIEGVQGLDLGVLEHLFEVAGVLGELQSFPVLFALVDDAGDQGGLLGPEQFV